MKKIEDASAGSETYTPGLYQAGAIALYEEQGPEAIEKASNWISEAPATGVQCSDGFAAFAK